ncbi:MAG: RluA family pseudouridine synthase [Planctomycetes bacterium]|nr:RluA family pseudouridine synthase [Planctomycetota bacterium]
MPPADELELRSRVPAAAHGKALLDYLLQRFPYHDRAAWLREIADGRLRCDGRPLTAQARLATGMQLVYHRAHAEPPVDDRITVLHDDAAIVVVRKPAHLPVHADGPFVRNTLVHLLQTRLQSPSLQLVHRLDRETSGLCVVARTAAARDALRRQFAAGSVHKGYVAVVRGVVAADFEVTLSIGHAVGGEVALRRSCAPDARAAKPAATTFTVLAVGRGRTLLRCVPRSGRTHQIRVHLEAAGHPIVGDKLYGRPDADYLAFVAHVKQGGAASAAPAGEPGRQLLHAAELAFDHPDTGQRCTFADPAPDEFRTWLDA